MSDRGSGKNRLCGFLSGGGNILGFDACSCDFTLGSGIHIRDVRFWGRGATDEEDKDDRKGEQVLHESKTKSRY